MMVNRHIRTLPFPLISNFTPDIIKQIKSIPDDDIQYSDEEIEWMKRALRYLDWVIANSKFYDLENYSRMRKSQIEETMSACEKQKNRKPV